MAVTVVSFRWLEILEKEFDKNFVDLDLLIGKNRVINEYAIYFCTFCSAWIVLKSMTTFSIDTRICLVIFDYSCFSGDLDGEEPDLVYSARQKLAGLSSCFAQLTHKAQTIFQHSAKTEVS